MNPLKLIEVLTLLLLSPVSSTVTGVWNWNSNIDQVQFSEYTFNAPEVPTGMEACLFLKTRIPATKPGGFTRGLYLTLNGTVLTPELVTNRPIRGILKVNGAIMDFMTPRGEIYVPYAPDFESCDRDPYCGLEDGTKIHEWEFKVSDLLKPNSNLLRLQSLTSASSNLGVVVADMQLRVKKLTAPVLKPPQPQPQGPLALIHPQSDPECRYGTITIAKDGKISFPVNGEVFTIESRFSMPDGTWMTKPGRNAYCAYSRKVASENGYLHITDQFVNLTNEPLPVMQRHTSNLAGRVKKVWCAGFSTASGNITMIEAGNPTSYAITEKAGLGFMALSDELQVHVMNWALDGILGMADNNCVIKPKATYRAEWVIVPTQRPDFWDFVNACRRIRNVNFPLTQMFAFLSATPEVEKWSDEKLTEFIRNKSANIVCSSIDYPKYKGLRAFGTVFQILDLSNYTRHHERIRRLFPDVKTKVYFHSYLDVDDTAARKYADARILLPNGQQANYGAEHYRLFFPTLTNQFGMDISKNVDKIFDVCKADGVYWDEMTYSRYKYHYGEPWDGISGDIDLQTGKLLHLKSSVTLLSQPYIVGQIQRIMNRGSLITNGVPNTRSMASLHYQSFMETGAVNNGLRSVLYSPVVLGNDIGEIKEIDAYRSMTEALNYGCLYSWYGQNVWPEYETLTKYMFPTTPIELDEGYIIGKERIVTNRSGLFGWGDISGHEVHVFNAGGREVSDFNALTKTIEGKIYSELRLAEGWTAAIIRR